MKLKSLLIAIFLSILSLSIYAQVNYDTARKVYEAGKEVEAYQKSKMDGTYVDYSETPTWVSVLYTGIGIGIVGFLGFCGYSAFSSGNESQKVGESKKKHPITSDNPNAARWLTMTVAEIAKELDRTDRTVMAMLIRQGIQCEDFDGVSKNEAAKKFQTPENREDESNRVYIESIREEELEKKTGNRGIILTVFGEKGVGDSVTSYIACHDVEGKLHTNYDIYNLNEYENPPEGVIQRTGFDCDINVDSLLNFYRTAVNGPFETTKLYQKKFAKDVAFISVWASTASQYLKECKQYNEMKIEIFWDGIDSRKDEYIVKNASKGSNEQIILIGYLVRMKNGKWKFQQSPNMALSTTIEKISDSPESLREPLSTMFQKIVSSTPQS